MADGFSSATLKAIAHMEDVVETWARWLAARQVLVEYPVPSLKSLEGCSALRNGREFDTARIVRNRRQPQLWKVGLVDDVLPLEDDLERARDSRRQLYRQRGFGSKVRRYLIGSTRHRLRRIIGYNGGRLRHRFVNTPVLNPHTDTDWALVPGVNFWQRDDGSFLCVDHGAIYEDLLTTAATRYPSQVATDLYTSSNAAYLFYWMAQRDRQDVWPEALEAAETYFRGFHATPRQRLEFDHREFDYTALRLTFGHEVAASFAGWTDYDPVNVFGLRWDTMGQAPEERSWIRRALVRWMVRRHQTRDGLIRDNHMGRAVSSGDLTYHQYCLAGLALGNAVLEDPKVDGVIRLGLAFSTALQLPNGEVSYYGRGANNIYHLAAYVAALAVAAERYRWDVGMPLCVALEWLSQSLASPEADGKMPPLPTALNDAPLDDMVGWHGSCAQYGAQSAFLLARAVPYLKRAVTSGEAVRPMPIPIAVRHPSHARLQAGDGQERVVLTVTAGSECMRWNGGQHVSGFAGLTALVLGGRNRLLTNERVEQDDGRNLLLADIPDQREFEKGDLQTTADGLRLTLPDRRGNRVIDYSVAPGQWSVTLRAPGQPVVYGLALQGTPEVRRRGEGSFVLVFEDGCVVEMSTGHSLDVTQIPVQRSCHGSGTFLRMTAATERLMLSCVVKMGTAFQE